MFYTIQNNGLLIAENQYALTRFYDNVLENIFLWTPWM